MRARTPSAAAPRKRALVSPELKMNGQIFSTVSARSTASPVLPEYGSVDKKIRLFTVNASKLSSLREQPRFIFPLPVLAPRLLPGFAAKHYPDVDRDRPLARVHDHQGVDIKLVDALPIGDQLGKSQQRVDDGVGIRPFPPPHA